MIPAGVGGPVTGAPPRKVLMVVFRFPPHGGGGVHRNAHFARHLPESGWHPHVLTGPEDGRRHVMDRSLLELVADVPVARTQYTEVDRLYRGLGKLRLATAARTVTPWLPNMQPGWIPFGWKQGRRLLRQGDYDLVYSSAYPISSHVVAWLLARSSGLPWVADYRDEWSIREVVSWPTPLHRRLAGRIDRRITSDADRVVTTSPAHTRRFARTFDAPESKYVTITNGFAEEDFPASDGGDAAGDDPGHREEEEVFTVAHVGTLFTWRSAGPFLEAVRDTLRDGTIEPDRLRVRLVGYAPEVGHEDLQRSGVVEVTGYVDHDTAVRETCSADLLLLVNTERTNIPAKTFEYLASGRPILAAVREGPTADLVRDKNAGVVVSPGDRKAMGRVLRDAIRSWREGETPRGARRRDVQELSRPVLTRRLAGVFDDLVGAAPSDAGVSPAVSRKSSQPETRYR